MKNEQTNLINIRKVYFQTLLFCLIISGVVLPVTSQSLSKPLLFDMGTDTSSVWKGFTKVTPQSIFKGPSGFGWQSEKGLTGQAEAYTKLIDNTLNGTIDYPPLWTNPITEDAIMGDGENTFMFSAPAGDYEIYIICGMSGDMPNQFFDFTVQVGKEQKRVQMESRTKFRKLQFKARIGDKPLAVRFTPRSKWVVNAILAWTSAEAASVQKDIIAPFEEWTYHLPPEEWAKWQQVPPPPNKYRKDPLPPVVEPVVSEPDKKRGFIVYTRPWQEAIYPQTTPRSEDINPASLNIFATPGEYEPVNFIVYPLKNLSNAKVTISDIGPIPAKNIDIRHVRFMLTRPNWNTKYEYLVAPELLEHFTSLDLKPGENAKFWLTVKVPENTPAGTYTGKITFECSGGKVLLPVSLRILPFKLLEDPSKLWGLYYRHPLDQTLGTDDVSKEYFRRKADLQLADMKAHGIHNTVMSLMVVPDANGNFIFDWDLLAEKFDLWNKHSFRGPVVMEINGVQSPLSWQRSLTALVYTKYTKSVFGQHLRGIKTPPEGFYRELTEVIKTVEAERKKRGWPEFIYNPVDEAGRDSIAMNFTLNTLKAIRAAGARTYVTGSAANPTHKDFMPWVDVWCSQPYSPDRETILADMKARKNEYWCYPNHIHGENDHSPVTGARMTFGFGFWRSGFVALIPCCYGGGNFNNLDGKASESFNRIEDDATPIPIPRWEAYREGHDDYNYIYTLEQEIAKAKKSSDAALREKAVTAEKALQNIWDSINVQVKYQYDGMWAPVEFDKFRWQVAEQILKLKQ